MLLETDLKPSESEAVIVISEENPCNFEVGGFVISALKRQKVMIAGLCNDSCFSYSTERVTCQAPGELMFWAKRGGSFGAIKPYVQCSGPSFNPVSKSCDQFAGKFLKRLACSRLHQGSVQTSRSSNKVYLMYSDQNCLPKSNFIKFVSRLHIEHTHQLECS